MSAIQDAVKALDSSSEAAAKEVKASLEMLNSLANSKKTEMLILLDKRTASAKDRHEIPPGVVLYDASSAHVVASKGPSEGIKNAVGLLLKNAEQNWKEAVGDLVTSALNVLLGSAAGATSTDTYYIIALDGHAANPSADPPVEENYVAVRIDYSLWVYNFRREGITDSVESAVVYAARRSTLDYENMPSTLQIEQSLKDIGMPKQLRDELLSQLTKSKLEREKNMLAYSAKFPASDVATHLATLR
jgi:hypothetical protein